MQATRKNVIKGLMMVLIAALLSSCASMYLGSAPNTSNKTAHRIHKAMPAYAKLTRRSWPRIQVAQALPLKLGMHSASIPAIRQRLIQLKDMTGSVENKSPLFDMALDQGLRHFQWRHGLKADGELGEKTLKALNVTPAQRLRQLKISMDRWAKLPEHVGSHYIRVNVASFRMAVLKDGNKTLEMKVIAGRPSRPTPTLYSKVKTIVFNPKWNIPRKITRRDIIPKILENPNYLAENNIAIYESWKKGAYQIHPSSIDWKKAHRRGFPYRMTQAPGDLNALGRVKFIFLNQHDVYMHDTPQKGLFEKMERAFSSGCVRLEKPFHLVEYFMQDNEDLDHYQVAGYLGSNKIKYIQLKNPIPVYITYITAWVDKAGRMHFREDIYRQDYKKTRG